MLENDFIIYEGIKFPKLYKNRNLAIAIQSIAYKYGITYKVGDNDLLPKMKETKRFIQRKCFDYFNINISIKQINYLLCPQKSKFPYTAIVIIETIYNLLKEENMNNNWKEQFENSIKLRAQGQARYESFLLSNISETIYNHVDEFMNTVYYEIFRCFVDSRDLYSNKVNDITMEDHCKRNFPSEFFTRYDMPESIVDYQAELIYMKAR